MTTSDHIGSTACPPSGAGPSGDAVPCNLGVSVSISPAALASICEDLVGVRDAFYLEAVLANGPSLALGMRRLQKFCEKLGYRLERIS